jgi:hypothetical protein
MAYIPQQAQPNLDVDGLRRFNEDQYREIARAWTNTDASIAGHTTAIATNTTNIATNAAAISAHEAAWTAYTPTLTAFTGSYISASAAGRYKTIGKTVFIHVTITITTVGTGTYPLVTLPVTPRDYNHTFLYGTERALTGKMVVGRLGGASTILVAYVDNTHLSVNGAIYELTGVYEAA